MCPKTGICVWLPHQCSWPGPGMLTAAPLLSGYPAASAWGWSHSAKVKTQTHRTWLKPIIPKHCPASLRLALRHGSRMVMYEERSKHIITGNSYIPEQALGLGNLHWSTLASGPTHLQWPHQCCSVKGSQQETHAGRAFLSHSSQQPPVSRALLGCMLSGCDGEQMRQTEALFIKRRRKKEEKEIWT